MPKARLDIVNVRQTRLPSLHHWSPISRCLNRSPEMRTTPHINTAYRLACVHAKTVVRHVPSTAASRQQSCRLQRRTEPCLRHRLFMSDTRASDCQQPTKRIDERHSHSGEPPNSSFRHPPRREDRDERRGATDSRRSDDVEPYILAGS